MRRSVTASATVAHARHRCCLRLQAQVIERAVQLAANIMEQLLVGDQIVCKPTEPVSVLAAAIVTDNGTVYASRTHAYCLVRSDQPLFYTRMHHAHVSNIYYSISYISHYLLR